MECWICGGSLKEVGCIDELDSDVDYEGEGVHKYPMFTNEEMGKGFKFKLGMEFCSMKELKQALKEYSVPNGREIIFLKNGDISTYL